MHRLLVLPIQRGIFAVSLLGMVPWLLMRALRELWRSAGAADFVRQAIIAPLSPWFEFEWWWYKKLEWYDWPVLPSLVGIGISVLWPFTFARLIAWIRG